VLARVLRIRMALMASSIRVCLRISSRPAPRLPAAFCSVRVEILAERRAASSREHRNETPRANQ
jgi:hypothetical protein